MAYGSSRYRYSRRGYSGGRTVAPFGRPLYPVPFKRKRPAVRSGAPLRQGRRVRRRTSRSYTAVKQKRRSLFKKPMKNGDNSSVSTLTWGNRRMNSHTQTLFKKVTGMQTESYHSSTSNTSVFGQQIVYDASVGLENSQLLAMFTKANSGNATISNEVSLFVRYLKRRVVLRNQSNSVGKLTLYDLVCRRQPVSTSANDPLDCFIKGYADLGLPNQHLQVGISPFKSAEFRRFWKVKRVTVIDIEPGQQHEHVVVHHVNRFIKSSVMEAHGGVRFLPGLSSALMAVHHGGIGHDNTTITNVNYMPMRVDYTVLQEVNYGYMTQVLPSYTYTNNLPAVADFDFMGENQDIDADVINA